MKYKLLLTGLFGISSLAQAVVVEGSGTGETAEIAKQNAINNAVNTTVGEFLVSKETLNDETISQKVLSYSNVYVSNVSTISEEQKEGLFHTTVSVDLDSDKLVEKLKANEPSIEFKVASAEKAESAKTDKQSTQADEPKEDSFEQLIDDLIIKAASDNTIAKIELTSTSLTEVKGEKDNNGNKIFELPFKVTIDKAYSKNMRKIFMALKDDAGKSVSLTSTDIATVKEQSLNKANVNEEKLALLKNKLDKAGNSGLRVLLEDRDGIELQSLEYNSNSYGGYGYKMEANQADEYREMYKIYRLISNKGFKPEVSDNNITFYTGESEGKIFLSLSKDILDELNDGGKVKLTFFKN